MRYIYILLALFSITCFYSCSNDLDIEDVYTPSQVVATIPTDGVANFIIDTENDILENEVLVLTNNSLNAVSYEWDFGNGDTSTEAQPTYKYKMHGFHNISLTVTDIHGNTHEASQEILVLCIFAGEVHVSSD